MLDFLFIVPLSPEAPEGSLRRDLQKLCFGQLFELNASYEVWLLGDHKVEHDRFRSISCLGVSKEEKLKEVGDYLSARKAVSRYLIRLDDDDLINTKLFDSLAQREFDVAHDTHHFFYDMATDMASLQERPWIANTAILKYSDALSKVKALGGAKTEDGMNYLFACDHSKAWHPHFERSEKVIPQEPIYVRILNPSSITASVRGEFSEKNYFRYLHGFGNWQAQLPESMQHLKVRLQEIRKEHFGSPLKFKPKKHYLRRFL